MQASPSQTPSWAPPTLPTPHTISLSAVALITSEAPSNSQPFTEPQARTSEFPPDVATGMAWPPRHLEHGTSSTTPLTGSVAPCLFNQKTWQSPSIYPLE